ncbi:mitochondrial nuclease [Phaffia rhodozyma]|uniref:Endonuclease n=1 Tax=Phaffia rhodozyma TaxID=264483 RepID=A0A0F7SQ33_PHARH|nr:mitochondrial nuclease [Phaffia rhodozyma]
MAPSVLVQSAIFSTGLLLGVGTTAYLTGPSKPKPGSVAIAVPSPGQVTVLPAPGSAPYSSASTPGQARSETRAILDIGSNTGFRTPVDGEIWKFGVPTSTSDVLRRRAYITAYDRRLQHPAWTAEHLTIANLAKAPVQPGETTAISRDKSKFEEDEDIPGLFRAKLKDYFRSGYDRGHMVPAADAKISQEAMNETFLLSNIAPQVGDGFNRHYWAYLEEWCRKLTNEFSDVYVFTIPLYLPTKSLADGKWRVTHEVIGNPPSISVPTHFSKVILTSRVPRGEDPKKSINREVSMAGFVLPNAIIPDEVPLESFQVPVEQIERASGLSLFSSDIQRLALPLCKETKCQLIVRRFDDTRKKLEASGGGKGKQTGLIGGGRM